MAIFIVPSELREKSNKLRGNSNLLKYISGVDYKPLSGLEALTGADVMISPHGMPFPRDERMILSHIRGGAKLVQIKFGHDLPGSIIDGRLNEALSRMLGTGAMSWQCLLLFVGMIGRDDTKGLATINGQISYGKVPMIWWYIDQAINLWMERGGIYYNIPSGKMIPEHFNNTQQRLDDYRSGKRKDAKLIWPKAPAFYNEIEPTNPYLKKWKVAQKIILIDDLRPLLCSIPNAKIGPERATAIWDYMKANDIEQNLNGFLSIVRDSSILNVPGIGKGILDAIQWGLFRTLEEREGEDSQKKCKKET